MSLFYLLPPRPLVGQHFVHFLQTLLPGLDWNVEERRDLTDLIAGLVGQREDAFIVFREDLPCEESLPLALVDGFGAEEGDEVIEVRPGGAGNLVVHRWRIGKAVQRPGMTAMEPVSEI